ncbi:hypothetical protein GLV89_14615 [Halomonas alkaliantarctica]|nr:hypothetical protein [Halomonas alkaliantarctica]
MNRPANGFDMRCQDLHDSANGIATIMRLIDEDQMRRDTDDETPFLTPGLTCGLSHAAKQLTERIHSLTDAVSLEYGDKLYAGTHRFSDEKRPCTLQAVKRKQP